MGNKKRYNSCLNNRNLLYMYIVWWLSVPHPAFIEWWGKENSQYLAFQLCCHKLIISWSYWQVQYTICDPCKMTCGEHNVFISFSPFFFWLGNYPLHLAAWNGHADVARVLINTGPSRANVNEQASEKTYFDSFLILKFF